MVYRDPTQPLRNLTVFDGFTDVGQGNPQSITIAGFLAPRVGPVDAQVGLVAYEGDFSTTGDTAQLGDTLLGTTLSPSNNYFNGTQDALGTSVTDRTPSYLNNLGFDIKSVGAAGIIPNGATSATINLDSRGDRYLPGVVTTAINLFAPDFSPSSKTVLDLSGNDPARVGDELAYTLTYTNAGQDPARSSVLTDPLPPNVSYVPGSMEILSGPGAGPVTDTAGDDRGEYDAGTRRVTARLGTGASAMVGGTIAVGATTQVRFRVTVQLPAAGTTISNGAALDYIADTLGDPYVFSVPVTNTPVGTVADLRVTKSSTPDPVAAGSQVTSTIVVSNSGPNPAVGSTLTNTLPGPLTAVSAVTTAGTCTVATGRISCALGTLASGGSATITVSGRLPANSVVTQVSNLASVTSSTPDPNLTNNSAGAASQVTTGANLSVRKSLSPDGVTPGGVLSTTLTVTNAGPSDARDVLIADEIDDPAVQALLGASAPGANCSIAGRLAQCTLAVVPAGATVQVTVRSQVAPGLAAGIAVADRATVLAATPDPDGSDNAAAASTPTLPPQSDLALTKQVTPTSAVAGQQVTYILQVTNFGPSDAQPAAVRDALPAGLELVSVIASRGGCSRSLRTVDCALGTLLAGQSGTAGSSATVTVVAQVLPDADPGSLSNTASVASLSTDPAPGNNSATAPLTVTASADLSIRKRAEPNPAQAGAPIIYSVTVSNAGPSTARGLTVTENLSPAFAFVSASSAEGSCDQPVGAELSCAVGDLASGGSVEIIVTMDVPDDFTDSDVTNTASVDSETPDPDSVDNTASFTSTTRSAADVSISKTGPTDPVVAGESISWDITVGNRGPSAAGQCVGHHHGDAVTNSVSLTSGVDDPTPPEPAEVTTPVIRQADLSVTKTASSAGPSVGAPLTYSSQSSTTGRRMPRTSSSPTLSRPGWGPSRSAPTPAWRAPMTPFWSARPPYSRRVTNSPPWWTSRFLTVSARAPGEQRDRHSRHC